MPGYARALSHEERHTRWGCRRVGTFKFKALPPTKDPWDYTATSGTYCWSHLLALGIHGTMREEARALRWWKKHGYLTADGSTFTDHARNQ